MLNTAGGITGGDKMAVTATLAPQTALRVTTQAAERAYRARPGEVGQLETTISLGSGAQCDWLPQETILFDGAALRRRLRIDLTGDARAVLVEPVVFGRAASGEVLSDVVFDDAVTITRDGRPLFADRTRLQGDVTSHLARPHVANGAGAMALVAAVVPGIADRLADLRRLLPPTAGASLPGADLLVARFLARDSYALRQDLVPFLTALAQRDLPKCWML